MAPLILFTVEVLVQEKVTNYIRKHLTAFLNANISDFIQVQFYSIMLTVTVMKSHWEIVNIEALGEMIAHITKTQELNATLEEYHIICSKTG